MELPLAASLLLQQAVDLLLRLDPSTREALTRLDGKVLRFRVTAPAVVVTLAITDRSVQLLRHFDGSVDVELGGSLAALLSLRDSNDALFRGEVTLRGDPGVAQTLAEVLAGIDLDIEEWLSALTGDLVAHRAGTTVRDFLAWLERSGAGFRENTRDYLQDEIDLVVTEAEVQGFSEDVVGLRADVDRLEARLELLGKQAVKR